MKEYDIEISKVDLSPHHKYILAENFYDAYLKAVQILKDYYPRADYPDAEITKIDCECEITEV
jgi:hypothetical protein